MRLRIDLLNQAIRSANQHANMLKMLMQALMFGWYYVHRNKLNVLLILTFANMH